MKTEQIRGGGGGGPMSNVSYKGPLNSEIRRQFGLFKGFRYRY